MFYAGSVKAFGSESLSPGFMLVNPASDVIPFAVGTPSPP
jgi:hypothetical protein